MSPQGSPHSQAVAVHGDADSTLKLPAVLDLAAAAEFLADLRTNLADEHLLFLDASAVELLTLPCIQIILSAARSYPQLAVKNPSEAFVKAFADLALSWPPAANARCEIAAASQGSAHVQPVDPPAESSAANVAHSCDREQSVETQTQSLDQVTGVNEKPSPFQANDLGQDHTDAPHMAKRVLTIDDSKTMRDMLLLTLTDAGFEVLQGVDGRDGLEVLGERRVDVVITDINMPKMDGYEVIRELRSNPLHKTTPILVLTTESDADKRMRARDAGATGWMVKPFDPEGLVAVINKVSP